MVVTKSEIIDLVNPNNKCDDWKDYPIFVEGATGQIIGKTVTICGGMPTIQWPFWPVEKKCFEIGPYSAKALPDLVTPTSEASSGILNNSLFIAGGNEYHEYYDWNPFPRQKRGGSFYLMVTNRTELISEYKQMNGVETIWTLHYSG